MKMFKHLFPALLLLAGMGLAPTAQASLIPKLGGTVVYDSVRNITWSANANLAGTTMNWTAATAWAANLVYAGFDDWRLPTALNADGSGPCGPAYNCTGSELGNMFYGDINHGLGGEANTSITTTHNANYNLFTNIQSSVYWSGTEFAPSPNLAWFFSTSNGYQSLASKGDFNFAWAVRSGDVAAVPEPGVMGLLGIGALAWAGTKARRRG